MDRTNIEIHDYDKGPVYDLHTYLFYPSLVEQSVSVFKNIMRHFNYGKIHIAPVADGEINAGEYQLISGYAPTKKAGYFKNIDVSAMDRYKRRNTIT